MRKRAVFLPAIALVFSACTYMSGPASTVKLGDLSLYEPVGKGSGTACNGEVLFLFSSGPENITQLAVEQACQEAGGDVLLDATISVNRYNYPYYTSQCVEVEGTVGKKK